VLRLDVGNLRFEPKVEEQLVSHWTANWLLNARSERERIETARSFASLGGQEKAQIDYAAGISEDLLEKGPGKVERTVRRCWSVQDVPDPQRPHHRRAASLQTGRGHAVAGKRAHVSGTTPQAALPLVMIRPAGPQQQARARPFPEPDF
jgi:hypothetical protein